MTCIVGLEDKGHVYLGCDSVQTNGYFSSAIDCKKIFKNGPLTLGYTSSFRFADLLQYNLSVPAQSKDIPDDRQYLVTVVVKAIRETLKNGGFATISSNNESGGTCLIAYKNKLYTMQDDYSIVRDINGYASVGSGSYFALGSLASTYKMKLKPEEKVKLALEAAISHCATVKGPAHIEKV